MNEPPNSLLIIQRVFDDTATATREIIVAKDIVMRDNPEEIANKLVNDLGLDGAIKAVGEGKMKANSEFDFYRLSILREVMTILQKRPKPANSGLHRNNRRSTMRFAILATVLAFGVGGEAAAKDADGLGTVLGQLSCSYYLDVYYRTELTGGSMYEAPYSWGRASGWINGFLSGYNVYADNGKADIVAGMSHNDTYRWLASWCRDNPSKKLTDAVNALIGSRKP